MTAGTAAKIVATADRGTINAAVRIAIVKVLIVDAQGRARPLADNKVSFKIAGTGAVIGNRDQSLHEADKPAALPLARSAFNDLRMATCRPSVVSRAPSPFRSPSGASEPAIVTLVDAETPLPPIVP